MQELREKTPFNCIVTGPTNCGKTEFLIKQLRGPFRHVFDYIVLVCPTYACNATYRGFANGDPGFLALSPDPQDLDEILGHVSVFFSGSNTLIILDDCAVSKDVAKRKSEFVSLAFSGRHKGTIGVGPDPTTNLYRKTLSRQCGLCNCVSQPLPGGDENPL